MNTIPADCLSNTKFSKQLSETAPTTFSRFTDAMMSFLQYVINALKPYGSNRYFIDIQMARDRLARFLADHAQAEAKERGPE